MPSTIHFSTSVPTKSSSSSIYARPQKKAKMSITQTYFLAHSARGKLSKEAARPDHNLRLLVGHANMLDHLMIDLANAEQEQERWFNKSVSGASEEEPAHVETVVEEPEADWEAEDGDSSDDESEYDEEDNTEQIITTTAEVDSDMEEDDEAFDNELALTRTKSRHSPPELSADSDSDSEDEPMPLSPPLPIMDTFSEKEKSAIATTSFYDSKDSSLSSTEQEHFATEGFFLPQRQEPTMIASY